MRLQLTPTKGLFLMLLGGCVFGCWMLWVATRVRSPIDMPISMSVGHVRTREFRVNLEATYLVEIEAERKAFPPDDLYCLLGYRITPQINTACATTPSVVKGAWVLRSDGQTVANGSTEDKDEDGEGGAVTDHGIARVIGTFVSEKNRPYVLDIDVLADGSRLNPGNPRLKVVAFPEDRVSSYWGPRIVTATVLLELAGAVILAISLIRRRSRTTDVTPVAS
jgi:hypothetical protein